MGDFWKYVKAAIVERFGLPFVPVSGFIALFTLIFAILGPPIFAIIGAGVELSYIFFTATNPDFQKAIDLQDKEMQKFMAAAKINLSRNQLSSTDRCRFDSLVTRCNTIITQQTNETEKFTLVQQAEGLSRLANVYLQLLVSKTHIENNLSTEKRRPTFAASIKEIERKLEDEKLGENTKKSLNQQIEILRQRQQAQKDTVDRFQYVEAELQRIEQQIELLKEQTVGDTSPSVVSERIDGVTSTLTGTNDWIKQHKEIVGTMDDMWSVPPSIVTVED